MPNRPLSRPIAILAFGALAALSCGREVTAPEGAWVARGFSFLTQVGPGGAANSVASDLVPVQTVRVVLTNSLNEVKVNRVVSFGANEDEIQLSIDIPLENPDGEILALTLAYANADGDTVFRGGPVNVPLLPSRSNSPPPTPPLVTLDYVGPGSNAERVIITPDADTLLSGDGFAFTAVAYDAQLNVVSAPIAWRSLDLPLAAMTTGTTGDGTTLPGRGTARIEAYLLNLGSTSDTALVEVLPRAGSVQLVSGNNQSALQSSELADSVVVRVRATDNLPMAGVPVTFVAGNGGFVSPAAAITDADGLAWTTWTLGATIGAQSLTAAVSGVTGSPITFAATATAPVTTAVLLHEFAFNSGVEDGVGSAAGLLQGLAVVSGGVIDFDAPGSYLQFSQPLIPTSGSFSLSFFVRNRTPSSQVAAMLSQGVEVGQLRVGQSANGAWTLYDGQETPILTPGNDGLFRHVAITANSSSNEWELWINGQLRRTSSYIPFAAGGSGLRVGRDVAALTNYFDGQMDDLRIYSGLLDESQITAQWNNGPSMPGRILWTVQPSNVGVGAVMSPPPCVVIEDAVGRPRTTYNGNVTVSLDGEPSTPVLGGATTVQATGGVACFTNLTLDAAATGLRLSVTADNAQFSTSGPFDVTSAVATQLVFAQPPSNTPVGSPIAPPVVVHALTAGGSLATNFNGLISVYLATGNGSADFLGTFTRNAVNGVATFDDLTISLEGVYTIGAASSGLTDAASPAFTMLPGTPVATQLVITQQPSDALVNAAIAPAIVIEARTATNVLATGYNGSVSLSLAANPGGATLGGTLTVAAVNGVATFSNLSLNAAGAGYTLLAQSAGLVSTTSNGFTVSAAGVSNSWINPAGGAWSDPANWSQLRVPIATDTVAITLAGTYTVSMDQNFNVTQLNIGGASGTQTLTGASRTVSTIGGINIAPNGVFQIIGGTVSGGAVMVEGTYNAFASVTHSAPMYVDTTGTLRVNGSNVYGSGVLTVSNGFTNDGLLQYNSVGGAFSAALLLTTGTLVNGETGTVASVMTNGGVATLSADLQNDGQVTTAAALTLTRAGSTLMNNGSIALTGANLFLNTGAGTSLVNNGDISIASGLVLTMNGGTADLSIGQVLGPDGILSMSNTTVTLNLANFEPNLQAGAGGITFTAPVVVPFGDSLRLRSGTFTGASFVVEGSLIVRGGVTFATPLDVQQFGVVVFRSSGYNGAVAAVATAGVTNAGRIDLISDGAAYTTVFTLLNAPLTNTSTGVLRVLPGTGGGNRQIAGSITNAGSLQVQAALTIGGADAVITNSGTIDVNGASSSLVMQQTGSTPTFTNTGSIVVGSGRLVQMSGGSIDLSGGTMSGRDGFFTTVGTTTLLMTNASVRPRITLSTGTTLPDPFVVPAGDSLRLLNGIFAPPSLTVDGVLVLEGSAVVTTPTLVTVPTSSIVVRGMNVSGAGTGDVTFTNGFTNSGSITMTSVGAAYTVTLRVLNGSLVNASGATISAINGSGGNRTLAAELINNGTLAIGTSLGLNRASSAHVNNALIDLTGGNLLVVGSGTTPSFVNNDSIHVPATRTLQFDGGAVDLRAGIVSGRDGVVSVLGTTALQFENATVRPRITMAATSTLPDAFTVPVGDTLRLLNGTFTPPSLTNLGVLALEGSAVVTTPSLITGTGSTILVRGITFAGAGTGDATITNGFTNTATIDLTAANAAYNVTLTVPTGALVNGSSGVIRSLVGSGGARTISAALDNQGTVTVVQPLTLSRADAVHQNNGLIELVSGNLTVAQSGPLASFANLDTIRVDSLRTLTFSGAGDVELRGGVVLGRAGFFVTTGTPTLHFENATLRPRVTLSAGTILPEPFTVPAGDTLRVLNGSFAPPSLTNDGVLALEGNPVITTGSFITNSGSKLLVRGISIPGAGTADATITNGFTNTAAIDLTAVNAAYNVTLTVTNGSLTNALGGTITALTGSGGGRTLAAQLNNQSSLLVQQPLTLNRAEADHLNSGVIDVTATLFTVTQTGTSPSFTNTGSVNVDSVRTFNVSGGLIDLQAGIVNGRNAFFQTTGAPTLRFTNATLRPRLTLSATTILPDPFEVPASDTLRLLNGTFAPPSLLNSGVLALEGTAVVTTPTLTTAAGSTILVRGIGVSGAGTGDATITNGFFNLATIRMVSVGAAYNVTLTVPNGTLTNGASGVIVSDVGSNGARTLNAQLENLGLVTIDHPLTLARPSAAHLNTGTINALADNFTITQSGTAPSFTNLGNINMGTGQSVTFNGGLVDLDGGLINGRDAFFVTTGAPTLLFTNAAVRPRLTLSATTVVPDPFEVPVGDTLRLLNGTFAPPSLLNSGVLALEGTAVVNTPTLTTGAGSTIVVRGINVSGAGTGNATITNAFTNTALIDLIAVSAAYNVTLNVTNGTLVNGASGAIVSRVGSGGGRTLNAQLDNQGTLRVVQALNLARTEADHVNNGLILVDSANFTVTSSGTSPTFVNNDSIYVADDRVITFAGGDVDLRPGIVDGRNAYLQTSGSPTMRFTSADVRPRITFSAPTIVPDPFVVPAGDTLRILNGTFAPPSLTNDGVLALEGAPIITTPSVVTGAGSTILVRGISDIAGAGTATATFTNGFTNTALLELTSVGAAYSVELRTTNGSFVNGATGTLRTSIGNGGTRTLAVQLDNSGTLDFLQTTVLNRASSAHINRVPVSIANSNFTVTQSGTSPTFTTLAPIDIGSTRIFAVNGGLFDVSAGSVTGLGTLSMTGTALEAGTSAVLDAPVNFGTSSTLASPLNIPLGDSLRIIGGTLAGANPLNVNGRLFVIGTSSISAPIVTATSGEVIVRATPASGTITFTTPNGWTNTGTVELITESGTNGAGFNVTNGTFVNAPGATLRAAAGSGGARNIGAAINNQGTFEVNRTVAMNRASSVHSNTGTINVAASAALNVSQSGTTPSFTNAGAVNLQATTAVLNVGGGSFVATSGLIDGLGTLTLGGTQLVDIAPAAIHVPVNFGAGPTLASALTIPAGDTLRVNGGALAGPGLAVNGTLLVMSPSSISAPITTSVGSVVDVVMTTLTIAQPLTINGALRLSAPTGAVNPTLTMTGQTLTIAPTGVFATTPGAAVNRILNAGLLENNGSISIGAPFNFTSGALNQRATLTVDAPHALTLNTLNLFAGSSTTVNGSLTVTTCNNTGGATAGNVPIACTP